MAAAQMRAASTNLSFATEKDMGDAVFERRGICEPDSLNLDYARSEIRGRRIRRGAVDLRIRALLLSPTRLIALHGFAWFPCG